MSTTPPPNPADNPTGPTKAGGYLTERGKRFGQWANRPGEVAISELCAVILTGGNMNAFCKEHDFPYVTMLDWVNADEVRAEKYARARSERSDHYAELIATVADEDCTTPIMGEDGDGRPVVVGKKVDPGRVAQLKLKSDNLKWVSSKLKPKTYGDKIELGGGLDLRGVSDEALVKAIQGIAPALAGHVADTLGVTTPGATPAATSSVKAL